MGNSGCCAGDSSAELVSEILDQEPVVEPFDKDPVVRGNAGANANTEADSAKTISAEKADLQLSTLEASTCDFTIALKKGKSEQWGLGMRKSKVDGQLFITQPSGKPVEEWHAANPTRIVKTFDEIIAVNGVTDKAGMLDAMKSASEIQVVVRRQTRWTVELIKDGALGLKVRPGVHTVTMIADGMMVSKYNKTSAPNLTICEGDQLVCVNQKRMDASSDLHEILNEFKDGDELKLTFVREKPGVCSAFPFADSEFVQHVNAGGDGNVRPKAHYKVWTRELAKELQAAVDRIFAENDQLAKCEFSVTIADPMLDGCPLIGCSTGFATLCGYEMHEIVGRNCRFLVDPVPKELVDQKMRDRTREFCQNVKLGKHRDLVYNPLEPWMPVGVAGEIFCFQMNARKDGSHFRNMFYLIAVELDEQPYILGLQTELVDDVQFQEACALACKVLRTNMHELDQMLSRMFWYSAPMRRQDLVQVEYGVR